MSYTNEQLRAIQAEGRVIVSASAGSGKTKVMIERIFALIISGKASVKDILAVTFTKKAAAQMREKLRAALSEATLTASPRERERIKTELELLPLADISTVHSFCARLIRTYFYLLPESGLSSDFRILSDEDAAGYSARAIGAVFERAYEQNSERFQALLKVYYRKRDKAVRELVLKAYNAVRGFAHWEALLEEGKNSQFDRVAAYLYKQYRDKMLFLLPEAEELSAALKTDGKAKEKCEDLLRAIQDFCAKENLFAMREARAFLRMPVYRGGDENIKKGYRALSDLNGRVKAIYAAVQEIEEYEVERARYEEALPRAAELCSLALAYGKEYGRVKREAGALDYNDLEHVALSLLSDKRLKEELSARYRYLFVDEYQDVNPMQEAIIKALAGENVFLVGDAKQAIYGFRGSRTQYFFDKEREFGGALPLTENFRSAKQILEAVNLTFAPVIDRYESMRGGRLYGEDNEQHVFCHAVEKSKKEAQIRGVYSVKAPPMSEDNALEEGVLQVVLKEHGSNYYDTDTKSVRSVRYGDIAILCRRNSGTADSIVRALTDRGIPATSLSKLNACEQYEGKLILNWLKYLDNAEDDIALAGAMLSCIGGFCDDDLAAIRLAFPAGTFRAAVKSYVRRGDELAGRILRFFEKSECLRALAGVRSAAQIICTLLAEGLEAEIAAKGEGRARLARVQRIVSAAESAGSTHSFLQRLKDAGEEIPCTESGGEDAVRVITMHSSKGLEFPVVILADLDTQFHKPDYSELLFSEEALFAPRAVDEATHVTYDTLARRAVIAGAVHRRYEEERNLLYVAMTRARCRLHLMLEERTSFHKGDKVNTFSDFLGEAFRAKYPLQTAEQLQEALPREAVQRKSEKSEEEKKLVLAALSSGERYPYRSSVMLKQKSSATEMLRSEEHEEHKEHIAGGATKEEGTAYHAFLQHVTFGKGAGEELARMKSEGLLSEEQAALLEEERLQRILSMPALSSLKNKQISREQTFLLSLTAREAYGVADDETEVVFQGAIDLLAADSEGYLILDYKYSARDDEALAAHYRPQIELYRKAVAKAKHVEKSSIRAKIINIMHCREINV